MFCGEEEGVFAAEHTAPEACTHTLSDTLLNRVIFYGDEE